MAIYCIADEAASSKRKERTPRVHIKEDAWNHTPVECIDSLPAAIDGLHCYKLFLNTTFHNGHLWNLIPPDQRKWKKVQTANCNGQAKRKRKIQACSGSHICKNKLCVYLQEFGKENEQYFSSSRRRGKVLCSICEEVGLYVPCEARKFTEFYDTFTLVKHIGSHTCKPLHAKPFPTDVQTLLTGRRKPKSAQDEYLKDRVKEGATWNELKRAASLVLDSEKLQSFKKAGQSSSSIQAVQDVQRNLREDHRFLIYTITN